jgi:hydroxymethylpyrimidine/phosphomethylpyrimidine kinase
MPQDPSRTDKARTKPVALSIAGSDNCAGAGIQADLKAFSSMGAYGMTAVTCVVAEVPGVVKAVEPIPVETVREQVRLCFQHYFVDAVKTGMLWSAEIIHAVADQVQAKKLKLVIDPVMVASSGDPLLQEDAVQAYKERLIPMATVVTPNLHEAGMLLGREIETFEQMRAAGPELVDAYEVPFLLKGGHLGGEEAVDLLFVTASYQHELVGPFIKGIDFHGAGCTYSAALAAALARGENLITAAESAKLFMNRATSEHLVLGRSGKEVIALEQVQSTPARSPGGSDGVPRRIEDSL